MKKYIINTLLIIFYLVGCYKGFESSKKAFIYISDKYNGTPRLSRTNLVNSYVMATFSWCDWAASEMFIYIDKGETIEAKQ